MGILSKKWTICLRCRWENMGDLVWIGFNFEPDGWEANENCLLLS